MNSTPITVTRQDYERLKDLLAKIDTGNLPYVDALLKEIERADVVESTVVAINVVTMNSIVRFVDENSGREHQLKLVYPTEAGQEKTISVLAPIGCALLGLSVDQGIECEMPNGRNLSLRVVEVVEQPEARLWHSDDDRRTGETTESEALDERLKETFPASDATAHYQ